MSGRTPEPAAISAPANSAPASPRRRLWLIVETAKNPSSVPSPSVGTRLLLESKDRIRAGVFCERSLTEVRWGRLESVELEGKTAAAQRRHRGDRPSDRRGARTATGASLVLSSRKGEELDSLAQSLPGGADRHRTRRRRPGGARRGRGARRGGRRRRRHGRQRGPAGEREARALQLRGGQAGDPGQLRVADPDGPRDSRRSSLRRARATSSSSPRSPGKVGSPRAALYSSDQVRPPGICLRPARGHAASRCRRLDRLARLRARRGDVGRRRGRAAADDRHHDAREGRPGRRPRDRAQPQRDHGGAAAPALPGRDRLPPPRDRGAAPAARRRRADRRPTRRPASRTSDRILRASRSGAGATRDAPRDEQRRETCGSWCCWCRSIAGSLLVAPAAHATIPERARCDLHRGRGRRARMRQRRPAQHRLRPGTARRSTSTSPSRRSPASGPDGNYPLIIIGHGYGGSKIGFGASGSTDGLRQFTSRGYAVFSMTDRGFHESCGSDSVDHRRRLGLRQRLHPPDGRPLRGPRRAVLRRRARRRGSGRRPEGRRDRWLLRRRPLAAARARSRTA